MAMNMRKWGNFAGGLAKGLDAGLGIGNTLANSSVVRKKMGEEITNMQEARANDKQYYDDMFKLIMDPSFSEEFYKRHAQRLAMQGPTAPTVGVGSLPSNIEQGAGPTDAGAYTGPGLAEY